MLGVAAEALVFRVHDEVEVFEGDLAKEVGHVFIDVHDVEVSFAVHEFHFDGGIDAALAVAVGGAGVDGAGLGEAEFFDDAGL